jgi:PAS domain S-box-containing protein
MEAILSQQRLAPAFGAFAVGIAVFWLTKTPFGLLAPTAALFFLARGRAVLLLHAALAIGLVGSLLVAAFYAGAAHDLAVTWAAFFAVALSVGAIVATSASAPGAKVMPAAIQSTTREQARSYPVIGPTLREKAAPRHSPFVSIAAEDDEGSAARMVAASFWGGTPFHMRYWRRLPDGSHRWTEVRTEPSQQPGGTQGWSGVSAEIDDPNPALQQPTKTASNPPNDDDAVRAAKFVENLLGNAWAFDAAGRPTYLTPLGQTLVAATLEEFQAAVDEGHTFFKRTAHPDDYDRTSAAWRHSLQTGDPFFLDRRIRRASGIHEWNRTGMVPTRDRQGRITGWYGSTIDLDSHRIAEAELRERERELRQLVNMVPSHLWRLTPDGEPIFFSKRMVDFLGLDVADMDRPGMSRLEAVIETIHPDDAAEFRDTLRRCLLTGESFAMRYRLRRVDGVYRWMSSRAEPMRDQDGRLVQWYGLCHDIDDQMHAEEALRRSERELSQLIDMVPAQIRRLTPDGEPTFFNKRLADFCGLDVADLDKQGPSRLVAAMRTLVHPDESERLLETARHSFVTGTGDSMKYRMRRADGAYRWVDGRWEPLRDESGAIVQWYAISIDIDDEMRAQEALRQSERRLQQMIDAVPAMIWSTTPDGTPTYVNKRFTDVIGATVEDITSPDGSPALSAIIHLDDMSATATTVSHSFRTGVPYVMQYRQLRRGGSYRWTETRAEALRDESGAILQWYGVSVDIDDLIKAKEALRESERLLRQLVETLPAMIYCATPDGEPTYRSRQLRDFLGFDVEDNDEVGKSRLAGTLDAVIHPHDLATVTERYAHSLSTGKPYALKHRLRRIDGEYRWVETRAAAMRNAEGAIIQWNGICLDIEDQVRAQEELRLVQDSLARASQAASLAELSASIAHEVNQPLAAIVANSHACERWLSAQPANVERAKITAERIIRDANSAADVVSRIRALFRQSVERRNSAALPSVIAEVRNLMAEEAVRRRVRMDVDVESDLPLVAFDRVQIQQVLINLIRNGMDAMESTAGERFLRVQVRRAGEAVQTEISDRGQGVKFPDKVFEPFFTTKENGMGMGLAICRSIVESHGGRLWVEGNESGGATFIFTLPAETPDAP